MEGDDGAKGKGSEEDRLQWLFSKLVGVESLTKLLGRTLLDLSEWLLKNEPPGDLRYEAPPARDDTDEERRAIEEYRCELPDDWRHWIQRYDSCVRIERDWRDAIADGKYAVQQAVEVLDVGNVGPLDRASTRLKKALQDLGGSIMHERARGPYPPVGKDDQERLRIAYASLAEEVNWVRAALPAARRPGAPEGPAEELAMREKVIRARLHDQGRADRAIGALKKLWTCREEWLTAATVKEIGIPRTTAHEWKLHGLQPEEVEGMKSSRVRFARSGLIRQVTDVWTPRPD